MHTNLIILGGLLFMLVNAAPTFRTYSRDRKAQYAFLDDLTQEAPIIAIDGGGWYIEDAA